MAYEGIQLTASRVKPFLSASGHSHGVAQCLYRASYRRCDHLDRQQPPSQGKHCVIMHKKGWNVRSGPLQWFLERRNRGWLKHALDLLELSFLTTSNACLEHGPLLTVWTLMSDQSA